MKKNNIGLHITKNLNSKTYQTANYIRFAVIDLNEPEEYPLNFLCILPRFIDPNMNVLSEFSKRFKDKSSKLAVDLLKQELQNQDDPEIIREIEKRLKVFTPKPKNITKCNGCGKDFDAGKYKYRRKKTCVECRTNKTN